MIEAQNEPDDAGTADIEDEAPRATADQGSGSPDPLVGTVIHGRFRIIAPIARGGMGVVYEAEQAPLGRLVAIKILSPDLEGKHPEFRKRFFLEAATVAKLTHPNTVTVFDYGHSDGLFFIVMELIDGVTLKKALERAGVFEPLRAVHVVKQICRSLREAHGLGVIHRDMKPGNIMLLEQGDEKDYVKVLDFGLVKEIEKDADDEDLTEAGVFMGSPKYMSPEQIRGEHVDRRSDIYSLGVLLYEMLTGKAPFVRDRQVQVLMDHINAPVPPMTVPEGRPPIPPELQDVTLRCLAKAPDDRFEDMEQLLIALKVVAGEVAAPSGELGVSSPLHLAGGTSVSGIRSLHSDLMRTGSSGSIPAPAASPSSGSSPPVAASPPVSALTPRPLPDDMPGKRTAIVLGVFAILAAAAILVSVLDPVGGPDANTELSEAVTEPDPEPPLELVVVEDPPPERVTIASVLIELESSPSGAMVAIGEQEYGPTPAQVELTGDSAAPGTELTFVFSRAGFRDTTVTRVVRGDGTLGVTARLRRLRAGRGSSAHEIPQQDITLPGYRDTPY